MFSPYYAWDGRRDPENHAAINVALYRRGAHRWALTERGRTQLHRTPTALQVGPSGLWLNRDALHVHVDERGWPLPRAVRGHIRLVPELRTDTPWLLEPSGGHHWWPLAPRAHVEARFTDPDLRFSGTGYLDTNWGRQPLESDFHSWTWARAPWDRGAAVLYDVVPRTGAPGGMALRFHPDGRAESLEPPPHSPLPRGLLGLPRHTRSEGPARVVRSLTDSHFYARSAVEARWFGRPVLAMHESLSLEVFQRPWAKWMLPFRNPRSPLPAPLWTPPAPLGSPVSKSVNSG